MGTPTVDYDTPVPCYASHATAASIRQIGWHVAASGATQGLEVRRPFTFAFVPAPFGGGAPSGLITNRSWPSLTRSLSANFRSQ